MLTHSREETVQAPRSDGRKVGVWTDSSPKQKNYKTQQT